MKKYFGWAMLLAIPAALIIRQWQANKQVKTVTVFADPGNKDDAAVRHMQSLVSTAKVEAATLRQQVGSDPVAQSLLGLSPSTFIGTGVPQMTITNSTDTASTPAATSPASTAPTAPYIDPVGQAFSLFDPGSWF